MAYSNFDDEEAAPPSEKEQMDGDKEMQDDGSTSLLPKSFFGGKDLEPGKECKVQVVAVHGDDVEVKYVPHDEGDEMKDGGMDGARNRMNMAADGGKMMAANSGGAAGY